MPAEVSYTESSAVESGNGSANAINNAPAQLPDNNRQEVVDDEDHEEYGGPVVPFVPDGGWGWAVVLGSFMIHVIADGIAYSFGVFVEDFVMHFECSTSAVGGLGSLMLGVTWGSGPIASALTNKFGCRIVAVTGVLIASFGLIISIWAPNIWFMYFSFACVTGLGLGIAYLPAIVAVSFYFEKRRSLAIGIAVCGSGIGTFVFAPLTNILLQEYTWKGTVLIEAGILLNCILCGMVFRPLNIPQKSDREDAEAHREEKPMLVVQAEESRMGINSLSMTWTITEMVIDAAETQAVRQEKLTDVVIAEESRKKSLSMEFPQTSTAGARNVERRRQFSESQKTSATHTSLPHLAGPMAPKDVFYTKSLHNIPQYRADRDEYVRSMMSLREQPEVQQDKSCLAKIGIMEDMRQTIMDMMDFRLLLDIVFILFAVSNLLTSIGLVVPYIFLPNRGLRLGFDSNQASLLISVVGISNTIGRVVFGYIADLKCVNRLTLYNTVLVLCGVCSVFSVLLWTFPLQLCYSFSFGFLIGIYVCLTPIVLVDLLGLEKLSNTFGLVLLFQGIGAVPGSPFAGWLYDISDSYDNSFYMMGICIIVSGAMLYPIPCIQRWRLHQEKEIQTEPIMKNRSR